MSKLPMLRIPTMSQTRLAVEGNTRSGVVVAQIRRSTSLRGRASLDQQSAHCLGAHVRGTQPLAFEDATLLDAGAFADPFIAGVERAREHGIIEDVLRHIPWTPVIAAPMGSVLTRGLGKLFGARMRWPRHWPAGGDSRSRDRRRADSAAPPISMKASKRANISV